MIAAISSPKTMRSDALHVWVVVILTFLAIKYPTAITQKYCGICFLSSRLLILFLTSMLLGLSAAGMGGLTWMIRHCGSAVFSCWLGCGALQVGCVGWVGFF